MTLRTAQKSDQAGFLSKQLARVRWVACALASLAPLCAQTPPSEVVIHNFQTSSKRGSDPQSNLLRDAAGHLYGTTSNGGPGDQFTAGAGLIYELDASGREIVLHFFTGADGAIPDSGLTADSAKNLYGVTGSGGAGSCGVVYKLDNSLNFSVLYSFPTGGLNGCDPVRNVAVDAEGNIYGVTYSGGAFNSGIVYKLDTTGQETVLYTFTDKSDGGYPQADVILDAAGNLYGTTSQGGDLNACVGEGGGQPQGCGVVFKVDSAGQETVLYTFSGGADGRQPLAGVTRDAAGNLYGTTYYGDAVGEGVVYKVDPQGVETVLHAFTGQADGGYPDAGVTLDAAGNLYGTTIKGGDLSAACMPSQGCGVVFKLDPAGQETVLYAFTDGNDGTTPYAGVILDPAGNLYGSTVAGGAGGGGVVFKLTPAGGDTVLHSFKGAIGGEFPEAGVIADGEGNLYGTTWGGGAHNSGAVYKIDSANRETLLYSFGYNSDGGSPAGGVVRDSAGNLYGTTAHGIVNGQSGSVYKIDPTGNFSVLHAFTGGSDGGEPLAGLVLDAQGNLYGTASMGGSALQGVVFQVDAGGQFSVLYNFTGGADGGTPVAGVIRDAAGNLYGTTSAGGSDAVCYSVYGPATCGVIYKLDPAGHETVLHAFAGTPDGGVPQAGVVADPAGNLYGTTLYGGALGSGVVYKLDSNGDETVLYSFTGKADGGLPMAGVVRSAQGNLYGTASKGGDLTACIQYNQPSGCGVVYEVAATGEETVLYTFQGLTDGGDPLASLLLTQAGSLFGTTYSGGRHQAGVIFQITNEVAAP